MDTKHIMILSLTEDKEHMLLLGFLLLLKILTLLYNMWRYTSDELKYQFVEDIEERVVNVSSISAHQITSLTVKSATLHFYPFHSVQIS